ncbi:hypothetical protein [Kitasatospora sp. NPDC093679]|uniref:hypothetical protein n=1 Tax=Kitasatospora sp. NPDC093679 TaxID=3154983 RepID=UPI003417E0BF
MLPAHRGRGPAEELLAEDIRVPAEVAADTARTSTDVGNTPMAAAFGRAGRTVFEHEYVVARG